MHNEVKQNKSRLYLLRVGAVLMEETGAVGKKHEESTETDGRPEDTSDERPGTDDPRYSV